MINDQKKFHIVFDQLLICPRQMLLTINLAVLVLEPTAELLSRQEAYSVKYMKQKLQEYYGNKLLTEKVCAPNVVPFLPTAETIIDNFTIKIKETVLMMKNAYHTDCC